MKDLHIFDTSNVINVGDYNKNACISAGVTKTDKGYTALEVNSGGLSLLFRQIKPLIDSGADIVFCCDRDPVVKRSISPDYKNKKSKKDVNLRIQLHIVELILQDCNIPVVYKEGYEADDCISYVVNEFKDKYNHIYIHTGDSDLYSLVSENVSITRVKRQGKDITLANFETSVMHDKVVPYNQLDLYKVAYGDTNDGIKPLPKASRLRLIEMCRTVHPIRDFSTDRETVIPLLEMLLPEAVLNARLVYRELLPPMDISIIKPNIERVHMWGVLVGCSDYFVRDKSEKSRYIELIRPTILEVLDEDKRND